jgi:peptidyl-prolyl cis-trans isomerase SurA
MTLNTGVKNILLLILAVTVSAANAQVQDAKLIDGIIATVGDEIILRSDLENQKIQMQGQGMRLGRNPDCQVFEDLLYEKLLLHQGGVDSVEVTESQIQSELDKRINVFVEQIGSREKLEEYYGKSISEIKAEFYEVLENQMIVQQVQAKITSDVKVTPSQVEQFFSNLPQDSLPFINAQVEVAHIVKYPPENFEENRRVRNKLREYREQVMNGEKDFATIAVLYSEDPGSAVKGGELGMQSRGTFVPEFDAVALSLAPGEISDVFETQYGFHIMQMIEKLGEKYNARHILLKPKVSQADLMKAKESLDEIMELINADSLNFAQAAVRFSDDKDTKNQNGNIINPSTGSSRFEMSELDPQIFLSIDTMEVGEISKPAFMQTRDGRKAYRLIQLKERTEPHRANMKDDYQIIQEAARGQMSGEVISEWINNRISITYIDMDESFRSCPFEYNWVKNSLNEN